MLQLELRLQSKLAFRQRGAWKSHSRKDGDGVDCFRMMNLEITFPDWVATALNKVCFLEAEIRRQVPDLTLPSCSLKG